jgi:hypothetical protein
MPRRNRRRVFAARSFAKPATIAAPPSSGFTAAPRGGGAALSPRMLRLACSLRNGSVVIELGVSKSQCGQSEA